MMTRFNSILNGALTGVAKGKLLAPAILSLGMTGTLFAQTAPPPTTIAPVVEDRSTLDFTAGVPRNSARLLYVNHSVGIENRTDPQAMAHLEAKLMAEDAANGVTAAKAAAPVAPVNADLAAKLKDAQARLKA